MFHAGAGSGCVYLQVRAFRGSCHAADNFKQPVMTAGMLLAPQRVKQPVPAVSLSSLLASSTSNRATLQLTCDCVQVLAREP